MKHFQATRLACTRSVTIRFDKLTLTNKPVKWNNLEMSLRLYMRWACCLRFFHTMRETHILMHTSFIPPSLRRRRRRRRHVSIFLWLFAVAKNGTKVSELHRSLAMCGILKCIHPYRAQYMCMERERRRRW